MPRPIRIVDVFTEKPLAGNQLAVVVDGKGLSTEVMQRIAREMNFSETTFVLPPEDASHAAKVRIFTPVSELPFAGHPTIGTAWVLLEEGIATGMQFVLEETVGPIPVRAERATGHTVLWMTHPQVSFGGVVPHSEVASALDLEASQIVASVPAQIATTGVPFLYVALRDKQAVDAATSIRANLRRLFDGRGVDAVFIFAAVGADRLYSRMFSVDIAEDPATGSASGPLGPFAVRYGLIKRAPRLSIVSEQGTKMGRQSFIHIDLTYGESPDIPTKIEVGGTVMPVLSGTLSDFELTGAAGR
ncbi:MAG TPA: PhzF family phenazine biosynthesis protein, partial [Candidatus Dormibacteraeota bacterium]|nr:PhzF family phenazine biosynthesis protein [Candidatus Dormibacteraeota bacterium]